MTSLPRYLSDELSAAKAVRHGFFTRQGGISEGIYSSLNCGPGSQDDSKHVAENRHRVQKALGGDALCTLYQVHSAEVVEVTLPWDFTDVPKADAMVTTARNVVLGILTADCAPVLFADAESGVIGAAHAGWKGAFGGVVTNTVSAMERLGAKREQIRAAIGPCIAQESYQVDSLFHAHFKAENAAYEPFFDRDDEHPSHYLFNLKAFVAHQCRQAGITALDVLPENTYTQESEFFSYRRTTHRQEPDYGRQISAIMLT